MEKQENEQQKLQVFIKSLDEQKLEYNVKPEMTIKEFKALINKDTSIEENKIRLIYKARNLDDSKQIKDILEKSGDTFHLVARLKSNKTQQSEPLNTQVQQPTNLQNQQQQNTQRGRANFTFQGNGQNNQNILNSINSLMGNLQGMMNNNQGQGDDVVLDIQADVHDLGNLQGDNLQNIVNNVFSQFGLNNMQQNVNNNQQNQQQQTNTQNQQQNNNQQGNNQQQNSNQNQQQNYQDVPLTNQMRQQYSDQRDTSQQQNQQQQVHNQNNIHQQQNNQQNNQNNLAQQQTDFTIREENQQQQTQPDIPLQQNQNRDIPHTYNNRNQQNQVHYLSNNPRRNQVLSVNQRGITISVNSSVENQNEQIFLDNEIIRQNLQQLAFQNQIQYNSPRRGNDNSATLLGSYLKKIYENLLAFLPHLGDASDILQNEPYILNQDHRIAYTRKIQMIGQMMETYGKMFQNMNFLSRFNMGNTSMQFNLQSQNSQQNETDEQRIERERQVNQNMFNILQRGIDSRTTIGQLEQMAGDQNSSDDLLHLIMRDMNFMDSMKFIQGDKTVIDTNKDKIKHRFQDLQIKSQKNEQKVKETLLGEIRKIVEDMFKDEGKEKVFEGFDVMAIVDEINDEYIGQFQEVLLQTNLTDQQTFSDVLIELIRKYTGKLAYEISEGLIDGVNDLELQFKKRFKKTIFETMSNEMRQMQAQLENSPMVDQLINQIWSFIKIGYDMEKNNEEKKKNQNNIMKELTELQKKDEEVKEQELSKQYKDGSI